MQSIIKPIVRGIYDIQKLRIEMGNRIVANFKSKLGQQPSQSEVEIDLVGKLLLKSLRSEYKRIADGVSKINPKKFVGENLISSFAEWALIGQYEKLVRAEEENMKELTAILKSVPIYTEFLLHVKGCGPAMSGVIISEIDIHKAKYPSSLQMYAGLDVVVDDEGNGRGRSKRSEHLIDKEYTAKDGTVKTKKSITYNPFLKTKLCGVLAPSFIKAGKDNPYSKIYYDYKNRLENHPAHKDKTKLHRNNMALRYAVKRFLVDLHIAWRTLEGLSVSEEYAVAKLGLVHSK